MSALLKQYQEEYKSQAEMQRTLRQKRVKSAKSRKSIFTIQEKLLFIVMAMVIAYFAVSIVQTQAQLFTVNKENVAIQKEIETQAKVNKDLKDQVSELSMPERIITMAQELGFRLSDRNVKVVE